MTTNSVCNKVVCADRFVFLCFLVVKDSVNSISTGGSGVAGGGGGGGGVQTRREQAVSEPRQKLRIFYQVLLLCGCPVTLLK